MGMSGSEEGAARSSLSERDRFWLQHLKRIEVEGGAAKAYAERQGLSSQALYQAKRRLVARGAWPSPSSSTPRFTRVGVAPASLAAGGCRLRLPGGALLEWDRPPELAVLVALVERVSSPR
jgi:hypothetical protein